MQLMMKESTAHSIKDSGSSLERYRQRPVSSTGFRVVSFQGFTWLVVVRVFLER